MSVNPAVKVGIIIFVALVALGSVILFLTGYRVRAAGYHITGVFDNAMGLIRGSEVRMAGVTIGVVDDLSLDENQRAEVRMLINRQYAIPVGSRFILRVGMLIGDKYVDIVPNREAEEYLRPNTRVDGEVPPRIEDLLPQAQQMLANLTDTSESLKDLLSDPELQAGVRQSVANIELATAKLDQAMAVIQTTISGEQDDIHAIVSNVALASKSLRELTGELERFAKEGGLQEDVGATLASARRSTESLERTTASLEQLVTAPQFQEDIRETVSGARKAVEESREVLERVGRIFGGPKLKARIPARETKLEALFRPEDNRFRATLSAAVPLGDDKFLDVGMFDIGAGNKLILQPGQAVGRRTDLRYGIYASRLGLGLDHAFSSRAYGSLDLYDPYEPRLDFRAGYNVTDDWGLLLGVDKFLSDNQFTLGVRLTR